MLNSKLTGVSADIEPPRWKTCVNVVNDQIGWIVGRYFVLQKFSEKSKSLGEDYIKSIKNAFLHRLHELDWIDKETRAKAIEKVQFLTLDMDLLLPNPLHLKCFHCSDSNFANNTLHQ